MELAALWAQVWGRLTGLKHMIITGLLLFIESFDFTQKKKLII